MSQREIKSLMDPNVSTPTKRRTRSSSVCSEVSEVDSQEPSRVTRRSTRILSVQAETKIETRSGSPRTLKSVQLESEVKTPLRTRTSSVSSILSDTSELGQTEGQSSRRTKKSGVKCLNPTNEESVHEIATDLKRSPSISSITSEIESQPTPLRSSRKSALIASQKLESLTPRKTRASSLSKESVSEQASGTPSVVAKNKVLDVVKHKDSPYKSVSGRKSLRLSNSFVDADESGKIDEVEEEKDGAANKLSTKEYEEIEFSSDDESEKKSKPNDNKRRKSILPSKNDHLLTINEDEDEIEEIVNKSVEKSPGKNTSKTYASPKKNRLLQHINQENSEENESESVNTVSNGDVEKFGYPVQTTSQKKRKSDQQDTTLTKESSPMSKTKRNRKSVEKNQLEISKTITENKTVGNEHKNEKDEPFDNRPLKKRKSGELVSTPTKESPSLSQAKSNRKSVENVKENTEIPIEDDIVEDVINEHLKKRKSNDREQTPEKKISLAEKSTASDIQSTEYEEITLDHEEEVEPIVEKVVEKIVEEKKSPKKSSSGEEKSPRSSMSNNDKQQVKKKLSLTNVSNKKKSPEKKSDETIKLNHAQKKYLASKEKFIAKLVDINKNLVKEIEDETKLSDETSEERIRRVKLLKMRLKMQNKRIKYLEKLKSKKLKKMIKSNKTKQMTPSNKSENESIPVTEKKDDATNVKDAISKTTISNISNKKTETVQKNKTEVVQKSKTVNNKTDQQVSFEKKLEIILAKKEKKRQLWLEKMAQKKLARKLQKKEEFEKGKVERRQFFEKRAEMNNFEKAKKKKKKNKKKSKTSAGPVVEGGDDAKGSFALEDIVAKLEAFSSSTENIPQSSAVIDAKGGGDGGKMDVRGQAKSGRFWKDTKQKFSTMVKTPGLRRPHSEKEKLRLEIRKNKELTRHILDTQAKAKEEHRLRRIENIKRREENAKKAEIVQVIKNPAKLKRMKKKQLRMIEKRDTLPIIEKRKEKNSAA